MSRGADRRELFKTLKKGEVAPLYYLHGPDAFMLEHAIDAIVAAALPEGPNDFNFEKFRGNDATAEAVRNAAETLPFLTKRRVVVVRDAQDVPNAELDALGEYFADPAPTTCMVVAANTTNRKLDGRTKAVQLLTKNAQAFEFKELKEYEVGDVVRRNAKSLGLDLDADAAAYLVEALGTDMSALMGSLEKIDLYLGTERRRATVDDVRAVVADVRVKTVFELADALGARKFGAAVKMLDRMLVAGESAVGITAMVARHFRIVGKLQDPGVAHAPSRDAAKAAGVPPFFVDNYRSDATRFSPAEVAQIRRRIVETDFALKSSRLSERIIMESLLYDVCHRPS